MKIAVTGPPGCGKTTLCLKVYEDLRALGIDVGGMISRELREMGKRVGFEIVDLSSGRRGILAHVSISGFPRVSKYGVNIKDLDEVGVGAIERAMEDAEIIIVDEIGPMELCSRRFVECISALLDRDYTTIATVHYKARGKLIERVRREFELHSISVDNRDAKAREISMKLALSRSPSHQMAGISQPPHDL